jgi:peptidoglycan/xylan/chitin deacetylase (PgdA/CDA1 family)
LDRSQIAYEVLEDRKALEDLVGYPVRGMAYHFGTFNERVIEVLRALGVVYSRTVVNTFPCFPPLDPLAWGVTAHQYAQTPGVPKMFERLYANSSYSGVFFPWGHGFEFQEKDDWAALERIYRPLSGKADAWYCTNIELFDCEEARRRVVVAANRATAYNPGGIAVTLSVDGALVDVPPGQTISLVQHQQSSR